MALVPDTPKQIASRRTGRTRTPYGGGGQSEPPRKKLKYIPGGPGGGGRYVDDEGNETPVGGTGPGGYLYTGPRGRVGRMNLENGVVPLSPTNTKPQRSPTATYTRPRRERPSVRPRYSSAAAAAAAVVESDGYKPREERGWEEFHPDLDLEAELIVYDADDVDGINSPDIQPQALSHGLGQSGNLATDNGASSIVDDALLSQQGTPSLRPEASSNAEQDEEVVNVGGKSGNFITSFKRKPGRPPRRGESMLNGLGSPPTPRIAPLPTHNPKEKLNLPRPVYRLVETFAAYEQDQSVQVNYVDRTMANVGYQESDLFLRPEKTYIRGGEGSIEEELDLALTLKSDGDVITSGAAIGRVEYDMDEQDDRWLEGLNAQRRAEQVEAIKPAIFEITMTQIEKEWHALEKRIPKPNPKPPQTHRPRSSSAAAVNGEPLGPGEEQDTKCAICDDGDCENTNAIVFCDGCDLAVHQECYGVPFIPEGQWLCRKCQLIGRNTATCIFCPNVDGAFKQTNASRWAHLLCAIWVPEVTLGNTTFMEPVMDVEKVPKQRWKLTCYICQQKMGACIQCGNKNCFVAFHVTCARRAKLFLRMKSSHSGTANFDASVLKAFCDKHSPPEWRRENDVETATADAKDFYRHTMRGRRWADSQQSALTVGGLQLTSVPDGSDETAPFDDSTGMGGNKRKRGSPPKNVWRLPSGAPVVPHVVFNNVENSLIRFAIRKRKEFAAEACKYWTLKREARRGAALLKRLQLQMETFTSMEITRRNFAGMGAAGRPRLQRRIEFAEMLGDDMEQIRVLCETVKERELQKLRDVELLKDIVDTVYFPIVPLLWPILEKAQNLDPKHVFKAGFDEIQAKLEQRYYTSVATFSSDLSTVFSSVIGLEATNESTDPQHQINGTSVPHSSLTTQQKDRKKLAKRIIKAVQGPLEEATRKEAELGLKPFEKELRELDALLDNSIRERPESTLASAVGELVDEGSEDGLTAERVASNHASPNSQLQSDYAAAQHKPPELAPQGATENATLLDTEKSNDVTANSAAPEDSTTKTEQNSLSKDETTDPAVIRLHLPTSTATIPIANSSPDPLLAPHTTNNVANAKNNSPDTLAAHHGPPTPPRSEKDLLAPLAHGGIPWYLEPFDPVGTTVHDERWTGREVLRGMSEELSELDDEEIEGLVEGGLEGGGLGVGEEDGGAQEEEVKREGGPKRKRRRWRGFR